METNWLNLFLGLSLNSNWHKQSNTTNSDLYNYGTNYDENQVGEDDVFMVSWLLGWLSGPRLIFELKYFFRHSTYHSRHPNRNQIPKARAVTVSWLFRISIPPPQARTLQKASRSSLRRSSSHQRKTFSTSRRSSHQTIPTPIRAVISRPSRNLQ